jgi:hypothetical protein
MASITELKPPTDLSGANFGRKGKFHNGWTDEQEDLMAKWADIAACYRWLHDRGEKKYSSNNMSMTIPVIVLSTLTGTANFALDGFISPDQPDTKKYAQAAIGTLSIFAGILTTLGNFFKYAQLGESNRVAGIAWGKFQRQIAVELSLHPNDRLDSMDFIKICRSELDRLIEQSPPIPDPIIQSFLYEFKDLPNLKRPDICKGIEHTEAYKDKNDRLKNMASEAALIIKHKKRVLREELIPDIDNRLEKIMEAKISELRSEISRPAQSRMNHSQIDAIAPRLMSRSISAYEPDWKRLISRSNTTSPPPPPHSSPSLSFSASVATKETPLLDNTVIDMSGAAKEENEQLQK